MLTGKKRQNVGEAQTWGGGVRFRGREFVYCKWRSNGWYTKKKPSLVYDYLLHLIRLARHTSKHFCWPWIAFVLYKKSEFHNPVTQIPGSIKWTGNAAKQSVNHPSKIYATHGIRRNVFWMKLSMWITTQAPLKDVFFQLLTNVMVWTHHQQGGNYSNFCLGGPFLQCSIQSDGVAQR